MFRQKLSVELSTALTACHGVMRLFDCESVRL